MPDNNNNNNESIILNDPNVIIKSDCDKKRTNMNIISSFLNTFKKDKIKSKKFNDDLSGVEFTNMNTQPPETNVTSILGQALKHSTNPATVQNVYSFSNLSLRTQCLLNSKKDFDQLLVSNEDGADSQNGNLSKFLKAKEVKVYITEPQTRFKNQAHHYTSIFNSRNDNNYNNTQMSLFNYLEAYSKKTNASSSSSSISASIGDSFDLTFIDLHCSSSVNENDFSLKNKYFRRILSKSVLNELLNIKSSNSICRLPSNCIFLVSFIYF